MNPLDAARAIVEAAEARREFNDDPFEALRNKVRREYRHVAGVEAFLRSADFTTLVLEEARAVLRRSGIEPPEARS
ncbi:MAG: hypothetical protein GIX03_16405 [Candidatus Eremiobacteraeota bacterium]|nr:hypothetical protein [Candidatus Eremiobacteraeota bacterium]MBC5804541.1 hypothetical protein [Candidatus Eremiobacteraeota bacterium]MBC5820983.1 hypothetical protein [Candidatus Eremiobacteraeota bacterium]